MDNQDIADRTSQTTQDLREELSQLEKEQAQEHTRSAESRRSAEFIGNNSMSPERKLLLQNIKQRRLRQIQRFRLSQRARIKLENIRYHIYSRVQGLRDTLQINVLNYLADQNLTKLKFSQDHGTVYFDKLRPALQNVDFFDRQIIQAIRQLCNQQIGRTRAICLNYYIDWMFNCQYEGFFRRQIFSRWQNLKDTLGNIIDSIRSGLRSIWECLKSAWNSIFG